MAINQLNTSNTFTQWLTATQSLIQVANTLTDGGGATFTANTKLEVSGTGSLLNVRTSGAINVFYSNTATLTNVISTNVTTSNVTLSNRIVFSDNTTLNSNTIIVRSFAQANAAFLQANTPSYTANSAASYGNSAFGHANSSFGHANSSFVHANSAFGHANSSFIHANSGFDVANSGSSYANSGFRHANSSFVHANSAFIVANTPTHVANSAASYANSAFTAANTALANTSGTTFGGDLILAGNLFLANSVGPEGGQLNLAASVTGNQLDGGSVTVDVYENRFRIFETGGSTRGINIDLANTTFGGAGVNIDGNGLTDLWRSSVVSGSGGSSIEFLLNSYTAWHKRITLNFVGVRQPNGLPYYVQLGSGGSYKTTGYSASSSYFMSGSTPIISNYTAGFGIHPDGDTAATMTGHMVLTRYTGNSWISSFTLSSPGVSKLFIGAGVVALSGTLDRIRFNTAGASGLVGDVSIIYE